MSSRFRPAEMIGDRFLPSPEGPTLLLTASDDRHDDDIQTAETDAYGAHDYYDDLPSPRWRDRLKSDPRLYHEHVARNREPIIEVLRRVLSPDQEKLWPPIEDAVRARAKDRQARIAMAVERARELRDRRRIEVLRDRNPIEFMKKPLGATLGRPEEAR
jgi:hypothetical protein